MNLASTVFEATISDLHELMTAGELTSEALVGAYLDRIDAYDRNGPELNGIVTVNPNAESRARHLDEQFRDSGLTGPLHGIPVLVKDQVSTADIVTTYGSEAFAEYVPSTDATIVNAIRSAGAVVIAKTNLPDWAAGFVGYSSVAGQTKNPYALDRDSGGSSAGTGAGLAANLGTVGIGEDTGGSIRVPASCCNLFGLRPTTGLVSREGLSPLVSRMDTPGPMARTVTDLARLLDVLVGFDLEDERTATNRLANAEGSYLDVVGPDGLSGARLGVLRQVFGDEGDPRAAPVTRVVESALDTMSDAGAELVDPVSLPNLDAKIDDSGLHSIKPKHDIDAFLAGLDDPPVESFDELYRTGAYHDALGLIHIIADQPEDPASEPGYWAAVAAQESLRESLLYLLAAHDLDALVFPDVPVVPPEYEALHDGSITRDDYPVNTVISSQSAVPSISMPAGFTEDGLPVGVELLGQPHSEQRLIDLASAYEHVAQPREPPSSAPVLES